jgi:hypothetical protein
MANEALVDEVGMALLVRCESICRVTDRLCPHCGGRLAGAFAGDDPSRQLRCETCEFFATSKQYHRSYKRDRLHGGRATSAFRQFVQRYPACRTLQAKMLCIDALIHAVHEDASARFTKPAAHNVIAGKNDQVVALLDELAVDDRISRERRRLRDRYREKMAATKEPTAQQFRKAAARRQCKHDT